MLLNRKRHEKKVMSALNGSPDSHERDSFPISASGMSNRETRLFFDGLHKADKILLATHIGLRVDMLDMRIHGVLGDEEDIADVCRRSASSP